MHITKHAFRDYAIHDHAHLTANSSWGTIESPSEKSTIMNIILSDIAQHIPKKQLVYMSKGVCWKRVRPGDIINKALNSYAIVVMSDYLIRR